MRASRAARLAAFNSRILEHVSGRRGVVCLGDSHAEVFLTIERAQLIPGVALDLYMVEGATASGLENPNSQTMALGVFRRRLREARRGQPVVVLLGEVDCGFVIWYRARKYGSSVDEQLEHALSSYASFLSEIRDRGFQKVIVVTPPLPTITDGQTWGDVANARREVTATQRERTELTLRFADGVSQLCARDGYDVCDATSPLLDPSSGLIADRFRNADLLDHHLNLETYARVVAERLAPLLR